MGSLADRATACVRIGSVAAPTNPCSEPPSTATEGPNSSIVLTLITGAVYRAPVDWLGIDRGAGPPTTRENTLTAAIDRFRRHSPMRHRGGRSLPVLAVLCALGVAVSGCGGSSNARVPLPAGRTRLARRPGWISPPACASTASTSRIPVAAGGGGGGFRDLNRNTPAFQSAFTACRSHLAGAFGNITPAQRAQFRQQIVKFAACLRQHGQNVPDPTFNDAPGGGPGGPGRGGGPGGIFSSVNRNSPAFQAAAKACQSQLPRRPGGGPGRFRPAPGG